MNTSYIYVFHEHIVLDTDFLLCTFNYYW